MRALPLHPRLATESTEPTEDPTHSPYSCCFPSTQLRVPVFIATVQPQSNALGGGGRREEGGEGRKKKVVRGSRGFRGYSISLELPDGIGNAIKVIITMTFPGNTE